MKIFQKKSLFTFVFFIFYFYFFIFYLYLVEKVHPPLPPSLKNSKISFIKFSDAPLLLPLTEKRRVPTVVYLFTAVLAGNDTFYKKHCSR